jgi:protein-L-isoaspartate(D-aspartate) O-methyltransferase
VPPPLLEQLDDPGILVIPVGEQRRTQRLVRITKENGKIYNENKLAVSFVDLVGVHAW